MTFSSRLAASPKQGRQDPSNDLDTLGGEQLPLMPVALHHRENGRRILFLVNLALRENGISRSRLAEETGRDCAQITRVLDGDGNLPADVLAAVLELDRLRIVLRGLAAPVGFDLVERKEDAAEELKRVRSVALELAAVNARLVAALGGQS